MEEMLKIVQEYFPFVTIERLIGLGYTKEGLEEILKKR